MAKSLLPHSGTQIISKARGNAPHSAPSGAAPVAAATSTPTTLTPTTRWKEIADAVQNDIEAGRLSVGDLLPSETALTQKWKVSRMTAHRAMQELQRSGLVTRQRGRGTLVAGNQAKSTGMIALVFHNPLDLLEIEYIRGINQGLSDEYQLLLCDSQARVDQEARYLQRMQNETDGIIFMPSCDPKNTPLLRKIVESGHPIVCVDRVPHHLEIDAVVSDNFDVSAAALREMVRRGHRRIAHFTQDKVEISTVAERHDAFIAVMREAGEKKPERLVRFFPAIASRSFETTVQLMHDALFTLLHQSEPPTAVFCLNDYCLNTLLAALEQLELKVPQDLEILSFHDTLTLMPSVAARLHRIVQDPRKSGQLAAERLKARMKNGQIQREIIRVPATIYSRPAESALPPRQNGAPASAPLAQELAAI